jgi:hypothetical protein
MKKVIAVALGLLFVTMLSAPLRADGDPPPPFCPDGGLKCKPSQMVYTTNRDKGSVGAQEFPGNKGKTAAR